MRYLGWLGKISVLTAGMCLAQVGSAGSVVPKAAPEGEATFHLVPDTFRLPSDGQDDAPSINRAASHCVSKSIRCEIDLRPRVYYLKSPVLLADKQIILQGMGVQERTTQVAKSETVVPWGGTWLQVDRTNFIPVTLGGYGGGNTIIADLGIYEVQPKPKGDVEWRPLDYPSFFFSRNGMLGVTFRNIFMLAITKGIAADGVQRLNVDGMQGQVFDYMVSVRHAYDVTTLRNIHQWSFWSVSRSVMDFQQHHTDVIILGRVDGAFISNVFTFGSRAAYRLIHDLPEGANEPGGVATKIWTASTYCDFTFSCILVDRDVTGFNMSVGYMSTQGQRIGVTEPLARSSSFMINGSGSLHIHELYAQYVGESVGQLHSTSEGSYVQIDSMLADLSKTSGVERILTGEAPLLGEDTLYFGTKPHLVGGERGKVEVYPKGSRFNVVWPKVESVSSDTLL